MAVTGDATSYSSNHQLLKSKPAGAAQHPQDRSDVQRLPAQTTTTTSAAVAAVALGGPALQTRAALLTRFVAETLQAAYTQMSSRVAVVGNQIASSADS